MSAPLFRSVRAALRQSFESDGRASPVVSRALADLRQSSSTRSDMTALDWVGQAGLTQRLARENLGPVAWAAVQAYHTVCLDNAARRRKCIALHILLRAVWDRAAPSPRRFRLIAAQDWAGMRRLSVDALAARYHRTPVTVHRWLVGQEEHRRRPGLVRLMDAELSAAEGALAPVFNAAGLTWDAG